MSKLYIDEFKAIPFFRDYEINYKGIIREVFTQKKLRQVIYKSGYLYIRTRLKAKPFIRPIHKLLAEAFILNPNNYKRVVFKDGNKLNINLNNLEWRK